MLTQYQMCLKNLKFHVPRVRSNYGKHTFKFAITKTWEEITTKIKTLSYHKFKKEYKRILVNSQRCNNVI